MNEQKMFCWQCQETAGNKGCTVCGVCGKTADVAALQDELVYETKRLSQVTTALRKDGKPVDKDINHLVTVNLFITITNANFDADAIKAAIAKTKTMRGKLATKDTKSTKDMVGVLATTDEDIRSLRELITYGLKGLAAYSKHANALMQDDEDVDAFIQRALAATLDDSLSVNDLIALALETGKFGVAGMALLDKANTSAYGNPEITEVDIGVRANPGILISGHDLRDLEMLLEQTAGAGIDVYTH
ncbi:MAG: hydroxylamine reductase, partial [Lentisphaerae bacterium]|nr:hydroxylamine reductase [Lentisphaerota bacterium]